MATITRFEDIEAWKKARELTNLVYDASNRGAFAKDFGLKDQIRRAAVSVMANIAEGYERDQTNEFIHYLSIAKGSCGEVRSHLYVALDRTYISEDEHRQFYDLATQISRAIRGFMDYLIKSPYKGLRYKGNSYSAASDSDQMIAREDIGIYLLPDDTMNPESPESHENHETMKP